MDTIIEDDKTTTQKSKSLLESNEFSSYLSKKLQIPNSRLRKYKQKISIINLNIFASLSIIVLVSTVIVMLTYSSRIYSNPIIGWGGSSFPFLYQFEHDKWIGHAHNLPFEIAISYGILPSIFLTLFVTLLLVKSINLEIKSPRIHAKNKANDFINKAWICSTTYLVLSHIIDIQYFDIRISLVSWILLAGIKCSFSEASPKTP